MVACMKLIALDIAGHLATFAALLIFARALSTWQGWTPPPWPVLAFGLLSLEAVVLRVRLRLSDPRGEPDDTDDGTPAARRLDA